MSSHFHAKLMFYSAYDTDDFRWRESRFLAESEAEALSALRRLVSRWNADEPNEYAIVRECDLAEVFLEPVNADGSAAVQNPEPFYRFRVSTIPQKGPSFEIPPDTDGEFAAHLAEALSARV